MQMDCWVLYDKYLLLAKHTTHSTQQQHTKKINSTMISPARWLPAAPIFWVCDGHKLLNYHQFTQHGNAVFLLETNFHFIFFPIILQAAASAIAD
jgi:hypothetical protein